MLRGMRAKIGLLVPAPNTVAEPEFYEMAPKGISIHAARMMFRYESQEKWVDSLKKMEQDIEEPLEKLTLANVNVIAFACTSGSFLGGSDWNERISRKMSRMTDAKVVTASTAVVAALKSVDAKKIALVSPYDDSLNSRAKIFLESQGFRVLRLKGLNLPDPEIHKQHPAVAYGLAKAINGDDIDGIFISCTDFRTIDIIEFLEKDVNKPVVSSNQATMWASLRLAGVRDEVKEFGRLFKF